MTGKFAVRNSYIDKIKIGCRQMSCLLRIVILFFLTVTTLTDLSAKPIGNNAPIMERTMQFIALQVSTFSNPFNGKDLTGWGYLIKKQDGAFFESFDGKTESSDHRYSGQDGIITVHPFIEGGPRYGQL
ncbi:MAG: hypothetical protein GZ094_24105, partial [Mariniphaga sp.]|nr:hypothetical protein [Mariniphaga sp.]